MRPARRAVQLHFFHVIFPSHAFILNEWKAKEKARLLTFVSV
ncbi:hypothetical protein BAT_3086 [Bacillus pumilus ATCC 7061]|nr:hypothetical protein BAT_3086 [Bacillus pumilus ATCC 7061]